MLYFQSMGRYLGKITVRFLLFIFAITSSSVLAATCTTTYSTSPLSTPQTWTPGNVYCFSGASPFLITAAIDGSAGGFIVQAANNQSLQFSNNLTLGSLTNPVTVQATSGSWNGLTLSGTGGTYTIQNTTFLNMSGSQSAITLLTAGNPLIRNNQILGARYGVNSTNSNPTIVFNTLSSQTGGAAIRINDTTSGAGSLPVIAFNGLTRNGTGQHVQYTSNFNRALYVENNFTSQNAGVLLTNITSLGTIDADPVLANDPTTLPSPIQVNGGTYNNPNLYMFGADTLSPGFYRYLGDITIANGANFIMGTAITNSLATTVGNTIVELANSTVDFSVSTGGNITSYGLNAARNRFRAPTPGGAGSRGNITFNTGSNANFQYTDIQDGGINSFNGTAALTSNFSRFINNALGLQLNGTTAPTITNSNIENNTLNLSYTTVGPVLTIEGVYWGAATPNTALFSGAGAIDFEPWRTGSLGTGILTSQAPATPNAFSPTDNAIIAGSVTQLQMTATDIGYYSNGTLGRMTFGIEIATDPTFTTVIERANPAGVAPLGASLNAGTFDAGTYANSVTATYTITSVLTPGTYYWRAAAFDPLGSVSYGNFGGSFANSTATKNTFIIGAPSLSITMNAINFTKGQNPAINADAGDYIDYVITYANTGTQPANNAQITNVLPTDTQFANNVIYNISSSTTVTVNVHSTFAGGSIIGQDINAIAPAATNVGVAWNTMALAVPANVLRIEFYFGTIPAGGSGTLTYRVRVK